MLEYRGAWFCRAECVLMQEYRAQLNRFTTLSSPGSHRLPPGLPAYVNPRIARQPQNMRNVLHLRLDRLHRVLLIILAMPALPGGGRVSSVGLRDTVPKASHRFMSHSKSFAPALHPYSFLSRQAGSLQSVKHLQNTELLRSILAQQLHMQRSHSSPAGNVQGNPKAQVSSAASWRGQLCHL